MAAKTKHVKRKVRATGRSPLRSTANPRSKPARRRKKNALFGGAAKKARSISGKIKGKIPGTIEKIFYRRTGKDAGPYVHSFDTPADIIAMQDGSIVIKPRGTKKKLWTEI